MSASQEYVSLYGTVVQVCIEGRLDQWVGVILLDDGSEIRTGKAYRAREDAWIGANTLAAYGSRDSCQLD